MAAWAQTVRVDSPLDDAEATSGPASRDDREDWATTHRRDVADEETSVSTHDTAQMRAKTGAERASPAVASADVASASAAVSASLPLSGKAPSDPGLSITTSQPSIVVQGKAARSARSERPGTMETSQTSVPLELSNAPAAVQAAAEQVILAHQKAGWQPPAPSRPSVPKAPQRDESSSSHMIALRNGTVINGRYKIVRMIGRGGMGTVYQVSHEFTGEQLALKLLHPALAENEAAVGRFRTEARAPVRIDSDHVVRVVDADICHELSDVPFMVMELLNGHDLRSELKRRGALPAGEVVLYLSQVAKALDKAHAAGIIHRDLKPANMYVVRREDGSPLVKVLDFGIAKLTDDAAKELTVAGQVFGTPWYMAPEQARGDLGRVGPGTDLWALGLIAYQLLTGMNYWTADGMAALVGQICYEPMLPPTQRAPHLGPLFDMWFAHACHRDPSQRFPNAREMISHLAQALGVNTSATISTDSGQLRHLDSSLQINTGQPISGPIPGQSLPPGMLAPASHPPIPGTALAHSMEGTNIPVMLRQPPQVKSNPTAAIALGVIVALVIGGAGIGVWMVQSSDPGHNAGEAVTPPRDDVPASAAEEPPADEASEAEDASEGPTEGDAPDEAGDDAEAAADDTPAPAESATSQPTAPPSQPPPVAIQPRPQPVTPPPPSPPPVAPKVGNIDF